MDELVVPNHYQFGLDQWNNAFSRFEAKRLQNARTSSVGGLRGWLSKPIWGRPSLAEKIQKDNDNAPKVSEGHQARRFALPYIAGALGGVAILGHYISPKIVDYLVGATLGLVFVIH